MESRQNDKKWTAEQDALAFLTDACLINEREIISHDKTWLKPDSAEEFECN